MGLRLLCPLLPVPDAGGLQAAHAAEAGPQNVKSHGPAAGTP